MWFPLQVVDLTYAEGAPFCFLNEAELPAPPDRVWAVLADGSTWPRWFKDFVSTSWTSAAPYGVGSTRDVNLKMLSVRETFLAWEPGRRFAFRIDAITLPLVTAIMEELTLTPVEGGKTRLRWKASYTPTPLMRVIHPVARAIFGGMFKTTLANLSRYLAASAAN